MSRESSKAKIEFIYKMINNIEAILQRHNGITNTLNDKIEARPATLMALMQIGESLKKIDSDILEEYELIEYSKGIYSVRNFIAHDYDGVDLALIEFIIRERLPILKVQIEKMIKEIIENNS